MTHSRTIAKLLTAALLLSACLLPTPAQAAQPQNVRISPAPTGEPLSTDFIVTVEDQPVPVYLAKVAPADPARRWKAMDDKVHSAEYFDTASFACFDLRAAVTVTITSPQPIRTAKILPTSAHILPTIDGKSLTFTLDKPLNLTLEINDNWVNSLHLFASPFETDIPRPDDPNVIYFPPGIHQVTHLVKVGDNKTVYIAPGAILRGIGWGGPVLRLEGKHITLRGRGIIDGSLCPTHSRHLLSIQGSDISVEGIVLRDSSTWTVPIRQSDRVTLTNVKVLGYRANSDGFDICNSRDVTVDGCFLRTLDDLIVVKSDAGQGPVRRIVAKNCVLWNQVAHALSIGAELRENVDDVLFTDCDVIHDTGRDWTLRVFHCDSATISNIRFENIRIEETKKLISLWIGKAVWSRDPDRGHITHITFNNIRALSPNPPRIELHGFDETHAIDNVRFQDVQVNNRPLTPADLKSNPFVKDVTVESPPLRHADVCIYAATPSGILAAVAAAREGRSVLLIEPSRWLGGILGAGIKPVQDCPRPDAVGALARRVIRNAGNTPASVRDYFRKMLDEYKIPVLYEHRLASVRKQGGRIEHITLENAPPDPWGCPVPTSLPGPGVVVTASVFIDASYEGDLLAKSAVPYSLGREASAQFHEKFAGVQPWTNLTPISPHLIPNDPASGLLPLIEPDHAKPPGTADDYTQAYNFRFYLTSDPAKRVPFTPPDDYDPKHYELVGRYVQYLLAHNTPPNPPLHKDNKLSLDKIFPGWLNSGEYNYFRQSLVTIAPLGVSRLYQDADYPTRSRLWKYHIDYLRGLHHFMSTDPRVPQPFRQTVAQLGLDRTHHPDTQGWPHQLYIRVARRMVGRYTLTESDVLNKTTVNDSVGLALYGVDTYPARRVAVQDPATHQWAVATEGNMFIGGNAGTSTPFAIPYRAITPKETDCTNLLVPVCFSATYVAYAAARMEPVFMLLGESAGVAASQAIQQSAPVQTIDLTKLRTRLSEVGQLLDWPLSTPQ